MPSSAGRPRGRPCSPSQGNHGRSLQQSRPHRKRTCSRQNREIQRYSSIQSSPQPTVESRYTPSYIAFHSLGAISMSVSRKLDAQRLRSALSGKPMEHHTSDNSHHLTPASSVSTGEAGQPNHAADMPIMRLSKKDSAPDMRKLNSRRGQIPDFTGVPSSDGPLQSPLSHHPVSKSYGNSSTNGSRPYSPHEFPQSFDLAPPPPNRRLTTIDHLYERLFSEDHLYLILSDPTHFVRFTSFINKHRSQTALLLTRYLETQKAIKAIEYANAIANTIQPLPQDHSTFQPCAAALLDVRFEARSKRAFETLLNEGLTSYVTRVLVDAVTDTLIKEITGNTMPIMRDLVGGLAEVFCLTDPSLKDDPIVYASEGMILKIHGRFLSKRPQSMLILLMNLHRILPYHPIWSRLRYWPQLSLSTGTKDGYAHNRQNQYCLQGWTGSLRDSSQLVSHTATCYMRMFCKPNGKKTC